MKTSWDKISPADGFKMEMRAAHDIVYWAESDAFERLKLWNKQKLMAKEFYTYEKDPWGRMRRKYNEFVLQAGMRSSKSFMAGMFVTYEFFKLLLLRDPAAHYGLALGSEIFLINIAPEEKQAKDTIYGKVREHIERNPWFEKFTLDGRLKMGSLRMNYKDKNEFGDKIAVTVLAHGSAGTSGVGRTCKVMSFDELNKFKDRSGKMSASFVYDLLTKSTGTFAPFGEDIRITVSSPMFEGDPVHSLLMQSKVEPQMLGYQFKTWDINPNLPFSALEKDFKKNPETFMLHYGGIAIPLTDKFFKHPRGLWRTMNPFRPNWFVNLDTYEIKPTRPAYPRARNWAIAGDPAVTGDAFGVAIGHVEWRLNKFKIIIDYASRWSPLKDMSSLKMLQEMDTFMGEVHPDNVAGFFVNAIREIARMGHVVDAALFDTWGFPSAIARIEDTGTPVYQNVVDLEAYQVYKDYSYNGLVELPYYPYVIAEEFNHIVRKGKRIDHPYGHSKDVADAVVNVVYYLSGEFEKNRLKKQDIMEPETHFATAGYTRNRRRY